MNVRRLLCGALAAATVLIAGCAAPARPAAVSGTENESWSGRLALQVEDNSSQSFAATFDLRGNAGRGELTLFTPLGGTLAVLSWAPGSAQLRNGNDVRQFESLDALAQQVTGTAIPVAALFDWLRGVPTPVPGWEPDLRQVNEGRIRARRVQPLPLADLRVAFER